LNDNFLLSGEDYDYGLDGRVLVLNQSYEPLTVCSPKKALGLLFLYKADMVEVLENKFVRTINKVYPFPSVIRINRYIQLPYRNVEISRKNIIKRDGHSCQYCGSRISLTVDHVIPKSRGGQETWENLVCACLKCNNLKGDKTPKEAGMELLTIPKKPNFIIFLKNNIGDVNEKWKPFLFY